MKDESSNPFLEVMSKITKTSSLISFKVLNSNHKTRYNKFQLVKFIDKMTVTMQMWRSASGTHDL